MSDSDTIAELAVRAARAEIERDAAIKRAETSEQLFSACILKDEAKLLEILHVCGMPVKEVKDIYDVVAYGKAEASKSESKDDRTEATCWRAPNPHPPHPWMDDNNQQVWCPGVKGTTMY